MKKRVEEPLAWTWPTDRAVVLGELLLKQATEQAKNMDTAPAEPLENGHRVVFEVDESTIPTSLFAILYVRVGAGEWRPVYINGLYYLPYIYVAQGEPVFTKLYVYPRRVRNPAAYRGIFFSVDQDRPVVGGYVYERPHKVAILDAEDYVAGIIFYADSPYPNRSYTVRAGLVSSSSIRWELKADMRYEDGTLYCRAIVEAKLNTYPTQSRRYEDVHVILAVVDRDFVTKRREELISDKNGVINFSDRIELEDGDQVIIRVEGFKDLQGKFFFMTTDGVSKLKYVYRGGQLYPCL